MGRQFVARIARRAQAGLGRLLLQLPHLAHQELYLRLLAMDELVQVIDQVFGEAGLDLEIGEAAIDVLRGVHRRIGTHIAGS